MEFQDLRIFFVLLFEAKTPDICIVWILLSKVGMTWGVPSNF